MAMVRHARRMIADRNLHMIHIRCPECTAYTLALKSLSDVEGLYHRGYVTQAAFEAYTHVWATSAFRYREYPGWDVPPTDPEVIELVSYLREALMDRRNR